MTRDMEHHYYTEKIFFGVCNTVAAMVSMAGAILGPEEQRWVFVTLAVGILVSTSLALMTRRNETVAVLSGRSLFSVLLTILGTRAIVHWFPSMSIAKEDPILLGFIAACVCIAAFFVGYGFIRHLNDSKFALGKSFADFILYFFGPKK